MKFYNMDENFHRYNVKKKLPWVRFTEISLTVVLLMAFLAAVYQLVFTKFDEGRYKIKGKMVDVGGYRLFTNATGEGKVTVVCESGVGEPFQQWNKIKEPLSRNSRVFTYERAGFGWSDKSTVPMDISRDVRDLKTVLKKTAAKSPYILVGHGYGGMIMMKFAQEYPDEVAGLVLIDSWTESYVKSEDFKKEIKREINKAQLFKFSSYVAIPRLAEQFKLIKNDEMLLRNLSTDDAGLYLSQMVTTKYSSALAEELKAINAYEGSIKVEGLMGEKPVVVITPISHGLSADKEKQWLEWQKELLKLSTKSEFIQVEDSSTYVHMDKPDEVISPLNVIIKKAGR